jgi:D-3-phosphoglycerate dehydrogenase / 2-oxoglutarate reductase
MTENVVDPLILDLLEWIGIGPRPYLEVMEVWRTSCPRLPVWEDANDRGFIVRTSQPGRGQLVAVSAAGLEHLRKHRTRWDGQPLLAPLARTKSLTA